MTLNKNLLAILIAVWILYFLTLTFYLMHKGWQKHYIDNPYDKDYQYDRIYQYDTSLMYDETTYICTDIWNWVIVPVPCWYPEYKETECKNKSDF